MMSQGPKLLTRLASVVAHGGGWGPTLSKTLSVLRTEGLTGLRARLVALGATSSGVPITDGSGRVVLRNDYQEWLRQYGNIDNASRLNALRRIETLPSRPLISILMPVYNPRHDWLIAAIESVRNQLYPNWQLCIADDASQDPRLQPLLAGYAEADTRIRLIRRDSNGHISMATNSALKLAEGDWIALLDQDDLLAEHALYLMVAGIQQHPQAKLLYSDEDKIDARGRRHSPYFKSAWNPDLFHGHNLLTHLVLYQRKLVEDIDGFRVGLEGAQDYDLALRYVEKIRPDEIVHVPHVLYHWRSHSGSTASSRAAKPYAMKAGLQALHDHFARLGISCKVSEQDGGYRVQYPLPNPPPLVSIVITSRNCLRLLRRCIDSILEKTTYPAYEIVLVDNDTDDPATLSYLRQLASESRVRIQAGPGVFNYSKLNNLGVHNAKGSVICLLNNDTEVLEGDWLQEMVSHALRPNIGAVGAKLLYPSGRLQHAGVILGIGGWAGHAHKGQAGKTRGRWGRAALTSNFAAVTGACLVMRKSLFDELGGLNETDLAVACSDVDLCLRAAEQGWRTLWTPHTRLRHHESASRGHDTTPDKIVRLKQEVAYMRRRWGNWLDNDPYYNPNLSLEREDMSLAWPPRINPTSPGSSTSRTIVPTQATLYAEQQYTRIVKPCPELAQCLFYHSVDLPAGNGISGIWDLRLGVETYLGNVDFPGQSVLEIGPASGFLSFHMEKQGAEVTTLEPPMKHLWDVVPLSGFDIDGWRMQFRDNIVGVRNSFWYLHHLYGSSVRMIEANPEAIPEELGSFDIGVLAAVLLHCRSPFSLIESLSRRVSKTMIITDLYDASLGEEPVCRLIPRPAVRQLDTWWALSPAFIVNALGVLGFERTQVSIHHQTHNEIPEPVPMFTVVAHRG